MTKSSSLRLFSSPEHECSYLPDKCAKTHFIDPDAPLDSALYGYLLEQGFRRSGSHIYRPGCDSCQACIPLRLPVDRFRPKRNQRRAWTRSKSSLRITMRPPEFQEEHFELYNRYMQSRHPGDEMADATPDSYLDFLSVKCSSPHQASSQLPTTHSTPVVKNPICGVMSEPVDRTNRTRAVTV